jgi:hypothetical protein
MGAWLAIKKKVPPKLSEKKRRDEKLQLHGEKDFRNCSFQDVPEKASATINLFFGNGHQFKSPSGTIVTRKMDLRGKTQD